MVNELSFQLPDDLEKAVAAEFNRWRDSSLVERIWERRSDLWTGDDESRWLGWLSIVSRELADLGKYEVIRESASEYPDVVLMGMGGSSLCPEVLSKVFARKSFHVLDSTVPSQIRALESRIDPGNTLFIVASKSGSTLEPNTMFSYFFDRVSAVVGDGKAGNRFVAITDPESDLHKLAMERNFCHVFLGDTEIGGRFSALSAFGLAPAASMDLDIRSLLAGAARMMTSCQEQDLKLNPGALLGLILGAGQKTGRDKLFLIASRGITALGAWLEQLIAESTGKENKAIIPVDRRNTTSPVFGGADRIFVHLRVDGDPETHELVKRLKENGQAVVSVEISNRIDIGGEFFRWEFATAVAGAVMGINPFNQPDVEAAKIRARELTDAYENEGRLPEETPFLEEGGVTLFADLRNQRELRERAENETLAGFLKAHVSRYGPSDYIAILAYVEMSSSNIGQLERIRDGIISRYHAPVCLQFGPRFLHSTGQAYKGGPGTGLFLQITADNDPDLAIPGRAFSFGIVNAAQARGDLDVLFDRGRRALRVHLSGGVERGLALLTDIIG